MDSLVNRIAIIPARGGSKRLINKNILDFDGKPMLSWTIKAALDSDLYNRIIVSTDCENIASVAIQFGAEVPFLRTENADDYAPVSAAIHTALLQAQAHYRESYDTVTQLMPNCPLRDCQEILYANSAFENDECEYQISAFEMGWLNPWWSFSLGEFGNANWHFPEAITKRSQDLPKSYCVTGAIWLAKVKSFLETASFHQTDTRFQLMLDWRNGVDIDELSDLKFAMALKGSMKDE